MRFNSLYVAKKYINFEHRACFISVIHFVIKLYLIKFKNLLENLYKLSKLNLPKLCKLELFRESQIF